MLKKGQESDTDIRKSVGSYKDIQKRITTMLLKLGYKEGDLCG